MHVNFNQSLMSEAFGIMSHILNVVWKILSSLYKILLVLQIIHGGSPNFKDIELSRLLLTLKLTNFQDS